MSSYSYGIHATYSRKCKVMVTSQQLAGWLDCPTKKDMLGYRGGHFLEPNFGRVQANSLKAKVFPRSFGERNSLVLVLVYKRCICLLALVQVHKSLKWDKICRLVAYWTLQLIRIDLWTYPR